MGAAAPRVRHPAPVAAWLSRDVHNLVFSADSLPEGLLGAGPDDVGITLSFARPSQRTVQAARLVRESGATVIAVTDSLSNALAQEANEMVFVSGQLPKDPVSGKLVDSGEARARQCLRNVQSILEAGGSSLDRVMATLVYVTDLRIKEDVNRVFLEFFPENPPARALVEVSAIADGVLVEVLAIALA